MNAFKATRKKLGMTQTELAAAIKVTQGSVSFYENGMTIPPYVAQRLIEVAKKKGHTVTFDQIYRAAKAKPEKVA